MLLAPLWIFYHDSGMGKEEASGKQRAFPLIAGSLGFLIGWLLTSTTRYHVDVPPAPPVRTKSRAITPFNARGPAVIGDWIARLNDADDADLEKLAAGLLHDAHRSDLALWAPLLARWSAVDPAGMISFIETQASPALRPRLLEYGWFAWGGSDPDAAFAAGKSLSPSLIENLLEGIAEVDPRKAAEFVTRVPNSQFAVSSNIAGRIASEAPDLAADLLARAVYDGGRLPFERARISQLAATDPGAAIAFARSCGVIGWDPVPGAVKEIARIDPLKAAAQVDAMPSSRSKALSSVALAEAWAARDRDAAAKWIRGKLTGPVLQCALVAAAAASGSEDPAGALDLVIDAGWDRSGDFFGIRDSGSLTPGEHASAPDPRTVTISLLQQWSRTDPEAARRYLEENIPGGIHGDIGTASGITP